MNIQENLQKAKQLPNTKICIKYNIRRKADKRCVNMHPAGRKNALLLMCLIQLQSTM